MLSSNDHRELVKRLDLLHFDDDAPGMAFWHPRGFTLYRLLESAVREQFSADGYEEVRTPQILRRGVWETSGHWQHFLQGMFRVADQSVEAAVKPVSCPGHVQILKQAAPSYRDLPIKLAEFGVVHRDEPGGTLHGLMRLRQFTQDDGHVFCKDVDAASEVERFCRAVPGFYSAFGFDAPSIALSTRPADRAGDDASWDWSEQLLEQVLQKLGVEYSIQPGAGAFYGPKLEFVLHDRHGRSWQCGTIQVDLVMPRSFEARYVDADGQRRHVVMLHRALYGSLERFLGILLEQHGAALPDWLAPDQIVVLPVSGEQLAPAQEFMKAARSAGLRALFDASNESLARRIAEAHEAAIPYIAVVGARESVQGTVTLRSRSGQQTLSAADAIQSLAQRCARPTFGPAL